MPNIIFDDIYSISENYKIKIRGADYDQVIEAKTSENIKFIFNQDNEENLVNVYFDVDFSFSFEDGFHYIKFSNFSFKYDYFEYPENMEEELTKYIKDRFVNEDRLSE
jgi:hypothetical protein